MSEVQIGGVAGAFLVIAAITIAEMRHWLPSGKAKAVIVFIAGVATIASLRIAGLPPIWFDGGVSAFGIVAFLALMAFAGLGQRERFQLPLCLGMAVTLGVLNLIVHF